MVALYDAGFSMNEINPDYVVVGYVGRVMHNGVCGIFLFVLTVLCRETSNYNFERIQKAINLVRNGAKLIGTNIDATDNV